MAKCGRKPRPEMKNVTPSGFKTCPECGEQKPWTRYHRWSYSPDGLQVYCKVCVSKRQALVRAKRKKQKDANANARDILRWLAACPVVEAKDGIIVVRRYGRKVATVQIHVLKPARPVRKVVGGDRYRVA